jgi:signal transduction histidine kinase
MAAKLKFRYSFFIFPAIMLVTFLVAYFVLSYFNKQNKNLLDQSKHVFIHNNAIAIKINNKLYEIQKSFQDAVAIGDRDRLENVDDLADQFIDLSKQIQVDTDSSFDPLPITLLFQEYYQNARATSSLMIDSSISESVEKSISTMLNQYNDLQDKISSFEEKSKKLLENHLMNIDENNNRSAKVNLIVIFSAFFVSIIITFFVSRAVVIPFRELNEQLEKSNDQLYNKNEELLAAQEELKENIATKDKFFSIIAHDLRGPLGGFMQLTELMTEEFDSLSDDEKRSFADTLHKSSMKVYSLLENLLEWSRIQRGMIPYNPDRHRLSDIVINSTSTIIESAKSKSVNFHIDIASDQEVFCDENMIKTVVRNLSSNALKFTPSGGKVTISSIEDDGEVVVAIEDTGIGMSKKLKNDLFNISVNTSRPGTNGEASTGLGLILCKEFVEKHKGTIWIESKENEGSTFYFSLPPKFPK